MKSEIIFAHLNSEFSHLREKDFDYNFKLIATETLNPLNSFKEVCKSEF